MPSQATRISFWKHSYARSSFLEVQRITSELLEINPEPNSTTRRAFTTAILTVYSRPFKQRPNIRISGDIVPEQHRELHQTIIELRDKVIAHRDLDEPVAD